MYIAMNSDGGFLRGHNIWEASDRVQTGTPHDTTPLLIKSRVELDSQSTRNVLMGAISDDKQRLE